jgi:hypothetical protein
MKTIEISQKINGMLTVQVHAYEAVNSPPIELTDDEAVLIHRAERCLECGHLTVLHAVDTDSVQCCGIQTCNCGYNMGR